MLPPQNQNTPEAAIHKNALSKLVAHLPVSLSTEFNRKAKDLQVTASVLASRLLAAIVVSNIYEAVLDDKD
jgi:hypothetical protein